MGEFDLWLMISRSGIIIKLDLAVLLCMSIGSWAIIFSKSLQFIRAEKAVAADLRWPGGLRDLAGRLKKEDRRSASPSMRLARESFSEFQRLSTAQSSTFEDRQRIIETIRHTTRDEAAAQIDRLFRAMPFLATCANAAPLLGMFGTIWGIMHSFQGFEGLTRTGLATVASGMSEALVTTALGLIVAIPATLAFNFLTSKLGAIESKLQRFATRLVREMENSLLRSKP